MARPCVDSRLRKIQQDISEINEKIGQLVSTGNKNTEFNDTEKENIDEFGESQYDE